MRNAEKLPGVTQNGKLKIILRRIVQPIVSAGANHVPEKERSALRNFNVISAVTGLMVIVFGGIIYSFVPSTPFLIALILEASAFACLIYLNHRGKYNYSKIGMYLTHCFSAVYFGSWLGEAMPVEMIGAFLLIYLIGSSCQIYTSWGSRTGYIFATALLLVVVYVNRHFQFITPQHFSESFLPIVSILCCGGMIVLMLFVTVNMIRQNDRLKKEADEANLHKTKYVHETSHELRTPLNTIVGNAELLLDYDEQLLELKNGTDILEIIHHLHHGSQTMRDIINNQLDMAKIEAGKFDEVKLTSFSLHDLLNQTIDQHLSIARGKGVTIHSEYDNTLSTIKSDHLFLLKINNNLLSNAIKFTKPASEVVITTRLQGAHIELIFTNASHLPEDKATSLFQPYHSERNVQASGTGLGLTITKKLVEYLNGSITVRTEPDHTHFIIRLPYFPGDELMKSVPVAMAGERQAALLLKAGTGNNGQQLPLAGVKILVAEDDEMNQMLLKNMLERWGAVAKFTDSAEEAISVLPVFNPDLIISDHRMPGMGGLGFLQHIQHVPLCIPFIMISGTTEEEKIKAFKNAGAAAHILKPVERQALMAALSGLLEKHAEIS